MDKIDNYSMKLFNKIRKIRKAIRWVLALTPLRSQFGYCANNAIINYPIRVYSPKNLFIYENTLLSHDTCIINSKREKVIIKKHTGIAARTTFVTNNHVSTVSIPFSLLAPSHINDKSADIIVEEDCWIGTGAIILAGVHLGRGSIVGAGSIVNKEIPPYAVVVGCPAKIIAVKFAISQIIEHEKTLYPENERFSHEYLIQLFKTYYEGKKIYGTSDGINEETNEKIQQLKRQLHYVEPF